MIGVVATINGEARELAAGITLEGLLRELDVAGNAVAIAVNQRVVPRARFAVHAIGEGDAVEIIKAVAGG